MEHAVLYPIFIHLHHLLLSDLQVILSEVGSDLPCDAQTVYSAGTFHESLLLLQQGEGQV